jgi:hypothetical protein
MDEEELEAGPLSELSEALMSSQYTSPEAMSRARGILDRYSSARESGDPSPADMAVSSMEESAERTRAALIKARERLAAQKHNRGAALLAASAALGSPTQFGTIGETMANVSRSVAGPISERQQFERERDAGLSEIDLALAGVDDPVNEARFKLGSLERQLEEQMAREALRTMGKGIRPGSARGREREAKIADAQEILIGRGLPDKEAWERAVALVDGHQRLDMSDALGLVREIDELSGTATEIEPGSLESDAQSLVDVIGGGVQTDQRDIASPYRMTLWDASDLGTGLWSGIGAGWNAIAGNVGLPISPEVEDARQSIRSGSQRMLKALSVDPDDPAAREIDRIREEINILPTIANNPPVYRRRLTTIAQSLQDMRRRALLDAQDTSLGINLRRERESLAAEIRHFLPEMGVPTDELVGPVEAPEWVPLEYRADWGYMSARGRQLLERLHGEK